MTGVIHAVNALTWPGAFVIAVIACAGAYVLGKVFS